MQPSKILFSIPCTDGLELLRGKPALHLIAEARFLGIFRVGQHVPIIAFGHVDQRRQALQLPAAELQNTQLDTISLPFMGFYTVAVELSHDLSGIVLGPEVTDLIQDLLYRGFHLVIMMKPDRLPGVTQRVRVGIGA